MCLNTWSLDGGTDGGTFRRWRLAGGIYITGEGFRGLSPQSTSSSLFFFCCFLCAVENMTSQLPGPAACCHALPTINGPHLPGNISQNKLLFLDFGFWLWHFITAAQRCWVQESHAASLFFLHSLSPSVFVIFHGSGGLRGSHLLDHAGLWSGPQGGLACR